MKNMKLKAVVLLMAGMAMVLTGCQNPDGTQNNTGSGALIGGAFGALTGAAIGGPRNGGVGALIGAAAGAIGGGLIGNSMDQEQNARLRAQAPQTYVKVDQGQPLQVSDVEALVKAGVSDDVIIAQIQNSHTVYHLQATDIIGLRNAGVSDKVVNFMINTPSTVGNLDAAPAANTVVVQQAPPPAPVEVVASAPGPDFVWVDGEWDWNGVTWVWVGGHWGYPPHPHAIWIEGRRWHDGYGWHYERGYWR
jgi:outer membrane lipoprotein SlyB